MDLLCLYDRRTLYPVSHIFTPFLLYLLVQHISLVVVFIVLWEVLEFVTYASADSYVIFPDGAPETICDIVLLDLGHGLLGVLLGWWLVKSQQLPKLAMDAKRWATTLVFAVLWVMFIPLDFECEHWLFKCDATAWGVILLTVLLLGYLEVMHVLGKEPQRIYWTAAIVGSLYLNVTWIPESTPVLMYYATVFLFLGSLLPVFHKSQGYNPLTEVV